jgi:phage-related tail protein
MTTEEKVEFEHRLTEAEHRAKSNTRRVEKLELQTEAIQSLATSVEVMVKEQGHQTEAIERIEKNVEKLDGKVEILEHKPAKRWESIVEKVILTVVGAVVGYLLVKVGL